jgi:transposase-like protein
MEGRQRRSFTDDYKRQAVDLIRSSGRSIGSVAKELGAGARGPDQPNRCYRGEHTRFWRRTD